MFKLIERIRQMSMYRRKWIAFSISFSFCLILFLLWISVWFPKNHTEASLKNKEFVKPTDSLTANISNLWKDTKIKFSDIKNAVNEIDLSAESEYVQD